MTVDFVRFVVHWQKIFDEIQLILSSFAYKYNNHFKTTSKENKPTQAEKSYDPVQLNVF